MLAETASDFCAGSGGADGCLLFEKYPDLLTPAHIAELTGFNVQYVRKMCREGELPAVQIGARQWFVPKPRFVEYVMAVTHDRK